MSSHEQESYPTTSLCENCVEFDLQTVCKYYVDLRQTYLDLKLKILMRCGYKTDNIKELKKEHKEEAKLDEKMAATVAAEEDEEAPVPLSTHANYHCSAFFQC